MKEKKRYLNRELSWLAFNHRVLCEAARPENPVFEQAKFLAIVSSNLDEFFMVRVGKLERKVDTGLNEPDPSGLSPQKQLKAIRKAYKKQVVLQHKLYQQHLLPRLIDHGISILGFDELSEAQRVFISNYFDSQVMPVLTPRQINPALPFPMLTAKRLYIAVHLQPDKGGQPQLCLVPVPEKLKRLVIIPWGEQKMTAVLLEDVITVYLNLLFPHQEILSSICLRVTRNTDFVINIDRGDQLIEEMSKALKKRSYGKIVRIQWSKTGDESLKMRLKKALESRADVIVEVTGPLDLKFLLKELYFLPGFEDLRFTPFAPAIPKRLKARESIFRTIRTGDVFLHHPYDSFEPVLRFVREAAEDDRVLAIKQTLYRVEEKSNLIFSLARAAQLGKQVTVLVEVRARFDEENNIHWCKILEAAGCHVLYGVPQWKTHSKITLVVRRENERLRRYVHIGTGNYNSNTANQYTDFGLLTCDDQLGEDAGAFFNIITGYSYTFSMRNLFISPYQTKNIFIQKLNREREHAKLGLKAGFRAKMNSLSDPQMIDAIYEAAEDGVIVQLLVRGICCLRAGFHENIRVKSIVGRFLEHSRMYLFHNDGREDIFISSADLMERNMDRRIELTAPVKDPDIAAKISGLFDRMWEDNTHAWQMLDNDGYKRAEESCPLINIQEELIAQRG